jgi:hypothetical protein
LRRALDYNKYTSKSYYAVPDGFALVTRLERIREDSPEPDPDNRWDVNTPPGVHGIIDYVKSLFSARKGFFRVIVFMVTDKPITSSQDKIDQEQALAWLMKGSDVLPAEIEALKYRSGYHTTAYVYEFEKPESSNAFLLSQPTFSARDQVRPIYDAFKKP